MIKIYANETDARRSLDIWIVDERGMEDRKLAEPVTLLFKQEEPGLVYNPTLSLPRAISTPFLQAMADMCFSLGIRPKADPILTNELSAVRYHLEDMRRLAFK